MLPFIKRVRPMVESTAQKPALEVVVKPAMPVMENASDRALFFAHLSHELRTPLNVIIGLTGLLKMDTLSAEKKLEILDTLSMGADQLMDLVNTMVNPEKMEEKFRELAAKNSLQVASTAPVADDRPCVLLVDDYGPNRLVADIYLQQFGFHCDIAQNGAEALEKVRQRKYHAILMDVQMRDMDGYQATTAIRAYEQETQAPRTKIIAITAHSHTGDREKCLASGMDDYLAKPYYLEDLKTRLGC